MKDRLIELLRQGEAKCAEAKTCKKCAYYDRGSDCQRNLIADYLLANGVIVPPCKVGDIVYKIFGGKIVEMRAVAIPLLISSLGAHLSVTAENRREACTSLDLDDFGKTVFLTREEAEKALAERSENDHRTDN